MKRILFKGNNNSIAEHIKLFLQSKGINFNDVTVDIKSVNDNTVTGIIMITK